MVEGKVIFTEGSAENSGETTIIENTVYDPREDTDAGIWLGIQAIIGTVWWICGMFVYIKNASTDVDL